MEEKKEKKTIKCSYAVLVIILFAALAFVTDYTFIERKTRKCDCPKCEATNNEVISDNTDNTQVTENDDDNCKNVISTFNYGDYSNKLKSERIAKFGQDIFSKTTVDSDIVGKYTVSLFQDGSLNIIYYNESKTITIANNVLSFYLINTGQNSGNTLYYIKEDGTVSKASIEYGYSTSGNFNIQDNYKDLKNIVSIIPGTFSDGMSGGQGPIFIDFDGNMIWN